MDDDWKVDKLLMGLPSARRAAVRSVRELDKSGVEVRVFVPGVIEIADREGGTT